jgi:hypothetical protein
MASSVQFDYSFENRARPRSREDRDFMHRENLRYLLSPKMTGVRPTVDHINIRPARERTRDDGEFKVDNTLLERLDWDEERDYSHRRAY